MIENLMFRAYETLGERNASEGFHVLFVYVNDVTSGLFMRMLLFALFLVVFLGVYFSQKRTEGKGDLAGAFAIAGFFVAGFAMLSLLLPGLITVYDVAVTIAIAIGGVLWLYMGKSSD